MRTRLFFLISLLAFVLSACAGTPAQAVDNKIRVVATTTIVGDVVKAVGGENIDLVVLIAPNTDEHGYQPTPQDAVKVAQADLVFMNGVGLEQFIQKLMLNAAGKARLVSVSDGVHLLQGPPMEGETQTGPGDPHVWTDPNNVLVWVDAIQKALLEVDPRRSADYQKNADAYRQQLKELDSWVREQVSQVPAAQRKLVTDHLIFTYFASRYGFEQVGAVVPGYSTLASPSAQELASLESTIQKLGVPVIFVGNTVNPALAERVAQDTHTRLVHILTGSLTDKTGPGSTYIDYTRYNVTTIIDALMGKK